MTDKAKIDDLKSKIKTLQSQIEEKNNLLKSVKTTHPPIQQKIKVLNSITEGKIKNLNTSLHYLQKENELFRKSPDKSPNYNSKTEEESKQAALLPIIKEKNSKHTNRQDEVKFNYNNLNRDVIAKMNLSPMFNKGVTQVSNDYEFSNIIRQLDALKSENLHLKKKLKDGTLKYNKEMDIRSSELEEMSTIRKDYVQLSEKFEELKKLAKLKNGTTNENEFILDTEEALSEQIKDLEKKYSGHIYENERLRQSLKTIKLKVKYLLLEKKKYLESNINKRNDNFCQYSMKFQEEKIEEPKPNAEEEQDLQELNQEIKNEILDKKLMEEMDDKNCEVNHEEFEEKNEEIFREDVKNEEEDANLNVDEKNDVLAVEKNEETVKIEEDENKQNMETTEIHQDQSQNVKQKVTHKTNDKRNTVQNNNEIVPKAKTQDIDKKRKTMGNVPTNTHQLKEKITPAPTPIPEKEKEENNMENSQEKNKKHDKIRTTDQKKLSTAKSSDIEEAKKRHSAQAGGLVSEEQKIHYQSQNLQKRIVNVTANYIGDIKFQKKTEGSKETENLTNNETESKINNDSKINDENPQNEQNIVKGENEDEKNKENDGEEENKGHLDRDNENLVEPNGESNKKEESVENLNPENLEAQEQENGQLEQDLENHNKENEVVELNNEFIDDLGEVEKDALQIIKDQEIQLVEEEKNSGNKNTKNQMSPNSKQSQNNRYRHSVNDAELESRNFKKPEIKDKKVKDDFAINKGNQNQKMPFFQDKNEKKPLQNLIDIKEEDSPNNNNKQQIPEETRKESNTIENNTKQAISSQQDLKSNYNINVNSTKPLIIFVLGGPGCGKGTQCAKIKERFFFEHLSTGDLLREELKSGSEYAIMMEDLMKEGKLVPSEILLQIIKKTITNVSYINRKVLLDGFPRNLENLTKWDEIIGDQFEVAFLLFFECRAEVLEQRILERAKTSGRSDDNIESFKKRIKTYEEETKPVLEIFAQRGQVIRISSENPIDKVFGEVESIIKDFGF